MTLLMPLNPNSSSFMYFTIFLGQSAMVNGGLKSKVLLIDGSRWGVGVEAGENSHESKWVYL